MNNFHHPSFGTSFWCPLVRTLAVALIGGLILVLSCLAEFGGLTWLYNPEFNSMPFLDCPELGVGLDRKFFVDQGEYCEITVWNWKPDAKAYLDAVGFSGTGYQCAVPYVDLSGNHIHNFAQFAETHPIVCRTDSPCSSVRVCTMDNRVTGEVGIISCPRGPEEVHKYSDPSNLNLFVNLSPAVGAGFYVKWDDYNDAIFKEFCDSSFELSVGKMVAVRGLLLALVVLCLGWLIADFFFVFQNRKRTLPPMLNMQEVEAAFNRNLHKHLWTEEPTRLSSFDGMVSRSVLSRGASVDSAVYKVAVCENPSRAFSSFAWLHKMSMFYAKQRLSAEKDRPHPMIKHAGLGVFVLAIGVLFSWAFLTLSPSDLVNNYSLADAILAEYGTIAGAGSTWVILPFLFLDELVEILLFLCIAPAVRWGRQTVFSKHTEGVHADDFLHRYDSHQSHHSSSESSISGISFAEDSSEKVQALIPDGVAAVVVVDGHRMACEETFVANLNSVIAAVGIDRLFVLQFSDSVAPLDDTVLICQSRISAGIQYVFVPERDKLTALYWFSKYYIPLVQLHEPVEVTHLLIADQEAELPSGLTVPTEFIESVKISAEDRVDRIGAVCFASVGDLDWKFETVHAIFQSDRSSLADTEMCGALILWERDSLELAAFNHSPTTADLGGDFQGIGAEMLRFSTRCDQRRIKLHHNQAVGVSRSLSLMSFARRKRLFFEDLAAFISPASLLNFSRLAAKPLNLVHLMNFMFDCVRIPVFISSGLRDPLGLGAMVVLFLLLQYVKVGVLALAIIRTGPAKPKFLQAIAYPVYHFVWNLLVLRPLSLVAAVVWAMTDSPGQCIATREDFDENLPPCLPFPDAPWFSVWKEPLEIEHKEY